MSENNAAPAAPPAPGHKVRNGWDAAARELARMDDDRPIWPEFANDDALLKWQ